MLNNFKYFKQTRKVGFNTFNCPKVIFYGFKDPRQNRWAIFTKPTKTQSALFWVSKYYFLARFSKTSNFVSFFKRKQNIVSQQQSLDYCLYFLHFFKTIRHARYFILRGNVRVNNVVVKSPDQKLREGDVVTLKKEYLSFLQQLWSSSFFFSKYKDKTVFATISPCFEVSFSSGAFCCVNFLRAVSSMEEYFFYTENVIGSNPVLLNVNFNYFLKW